MNNNETTSKRTVLLKSFSLILLLIAISTLYYVLIEFKTNLIVVILIIVFILLTFSGLIFRSRKQKRIYNQLFPGKKRSEPIKRREEFRINKEPDLKKLSDINLNFKYREPLIKKCENCGMVIASYVKKCPICGTPIK
ncbi:MAG: hypothetical protein ACFE8B_15055 [Candidatus Hermodarchaeota archaeon]